MSESLQQNPPVLTGAQEIDREFTILLKSNMNGFVDRELARELDRLAADARPPCNNMGGKSPSPPPFIPHGEKCDHITNREYDYIHQKTKIDFLAYTSSLEVDSGKELLETIWPGVEYSRNAKGMYGYPESFSISREGVAFGVYCTGAKAHDRSLWSMTGEACSVLTDEEVELAHDALSLAEVDVRLSRVDICLDVFGGVTWDHARHRYDMGDFIHRRGPSSLKNPELKEIGVTRDGKNQGRTMQVGKRSAHIVGRVYEKGLEVFAKLPENLRMLSDQREQESGVPVVFADDWLRLEVEYKRDGDRELPFEMLLMRDRYFAGSFPYFADVLGRADGVRPRGLRSSFDVDLLAMIQNGKRSYGSLVYSLQQLGFPPVAIVDLLSSGRNNDKLVKSGLFGEIKRRIDELRANDPDFDIPF